MTYVPIHVKAMGCQLFYVYGVVMAIPQLIQEKGLGMLKPSMPNPRSRRRYAAGRAERAFVWGSWEE